MDYQSKILKSIVKNIIENKPKYQGGLYGYTPPFMASYQIPQLGFGAVDIYNNAKSFLNSADTYQNALKSNKGVSEMNPQEIESYLKLSKEEKLEKDKKIAENIYEANYDYTLDKGKLLNTSFGLVAGSLGMAANSRYNQNQMNDYMSRFRNNPTTYIQTNPYENVYSPNSMFQSGGFKNKKIPMPSEILGYKDYSSFKYNPQIKINSNYITMNDVSQPLEVTTSNGEVTTLEPNSGNYYFPNAEYVIERPIYNNYEKGGYLKNKNTYVTKDGRETRRGLWANVHLKRKREGKKQTGDFDYSYGDFSPNLDSFSSNQEELELQELQQPKNEFEYDYSDFEAKDEKDDLDELMFDLDDQNKKKIRQNRKMMEMVSGGQGLPRGQRLGKQGESISVRHNNPGNAKFSKLAAQFGGVPGEYAPENDGTYFAYFPTIEQGLAYQKALLLGKGYRNLTVPEALNKWADGTYTNQKFIHMFGQKKIADLNDSELSLLIREQIRNEDAQMYKRIYGGR